MSVLIVVAIIALLLSSGAPCPLGLTGDPTILPKPPRLRDRRLL